MKVIEFDWDFIEQYLPKYSSRNDVLESDILQRYIDNEDVLVSDMKWIKEIGSDDDIIAYINQLNCRLYNESMKAYKQQKSEPEPKVEKFSINLVRIGYAFASVEVEATSLEDAESKALDMAGDLDYHEKDAEYKIDDF